MQLASSLFPDLDTLQMYGFQLSKFSAIAEHSELKSTHLQDAAKKLELKLAD